MAKNINTGIYRIKCKPTNKQYIGSASSNRGFTNRWACHKNLLEQQKHHSKYLQNAWNKYGSEAFEFNIIEECPPELCLELEQWYLDNWKPEFNISPNAKSTLGIRRSKEYKDRMSRIKLGIKRQPHSEESKKKISLAMKGKIMPMSTKEKISISLKNKKDRLRDPQNGRFLRKNG